MILGEMLVSSCSISTIGLSSVATEAMSSARMNILKYMKVKTTKENLI